MSDEFSNEKRADILQAFFKHYFEMAMDHHTKAQTTSNILLLIVAAIIGLVSRADKIGDDVGFLAGLAVSFIGLFGSVWAWKQHERYHYWEHIAYEYQEELAKIVPELKTGKDEGYTHRAEKAAAKEFGRLFAKHILDRHLWVSLHIIIAVIGLVLMAVSARVPFVKDLASIVVWEITFKQLVVCIVGLIILLWIGTLIKYGIRRRRKQQQPPSEKLQGNTK